MKELGEGVRRIYEEMRLNDLTAPEFDSDRSTFTVRLFNRSVYTREQRLWLETFDHLHLTREERDVVLLGYDQHVISPQEILDATGIGDTDVYRQLVEALT